MSTEIEVTDPDTQLSETQKMLMERMSKADMGSVAITDQAGGIRLVSLEDVMKFAKVMAVSGSAVPPHLRGQIGTCLAVTIQAVEWKLSPFAVANKSYEVNGRIAYESQLVQAIILRRAPITGRFEVEYTGEGPTRQCTITATMITGEKKSYTSPHMSTIKVKNSPLWTNDPDQQLFYYSGRALCRRHFPDVLLGIYTPDDLYGPEMRDVTPRRPRVALADRLSAIAAGGNGDPPHEPETGEIKQAEDIISDDVAERVETALAMDAAMAAGEAKREHAKRVLAHQEAAAAAIDIGTQRLLGDARAAANRGAKFFKQWEGRLNSEHYDRLRLHLPALRAEAVAADVAKASA